MVTVENCIRNMEAYLEIQLVMHDNDFTVEWDVDESIKNEKMPKLLLQPVVENALEHGLDEKEEGERKLKLSFLDMDQEMLIMVQDNGPGMDQEKADTLVTYQAQGYGLKNVQRPDPSSVRRGLRGPHFQPSGRGNEGGDEIS